MHNIANLFYFGTTLYMFRAAFPSIIRSPRLYIQHKVYVIQVLWLLARKQPQNLYGMMLYVQSTMHGPANVRPLVIYCDKVCFYKNSTTDYYRVRIGLCTLLTC